MVSAYIRLSDIAHQTCSKRKVQKKESNCCNLKKHCVMIILRNECLTKLAEGGKTIDMIRQGVLSL